MPFDAVFLHEIVKELSAECVGARAEKLHQPERDEVIILLRLANKNMRLCACASVNSPRLQLTETAKENPEAPPMFCMLLRKHLTGGKLKAVEQLEFERVARLVFSTVNELGDESERSLVLEILGRQTNILLLDEKGKIIDSLRRRDITEGSGRQVIPGVLYELPEAYGKQNPLREFPKIREELLGYTEPIFLEKALISKIMGLSPLLAREAAARAGLSGEQRFDELTAIQKERLAAQLEKILLSDENRAPTRLVDESGREKDFTVTEIRQYGEKYKSVTEESYSKLLDRFYSSKEAAESLARKSAQLIKLCQGTIQKLNRKIENQQKELLSCAEREKYRLYGELLTVNISSIERGAGYAELPNYYEEGAPGIKIPLNPQKTPAKNAQDYFKKYAKLKTAEAILTEQIAKAKAELDYFKAVLEFLKLSENQADIAEIKNELIEGGYIKRGSRDKKKKPEKEGFLKFKTSDGFLVLAGKNNTQNDTLTFKTAGKGDFWLHALSQAGSHIILKTGGEAPTELALTEAAEIAANYSAARGGDNVAVTYTDVKNIKKPAGAKPGYVIYSSSKTAYVTPDEKKISAMRI